jgi:catechol 2,3-dioxygenase-like lactoylglutathione lyase family enzyme
LGALGVLLAAATSGRLEGSPSPSPRTPPRSYNYEAVLSYELGNDYNSITISSPAVLEGLQRRGLAPPGAAAATLRAPDGYTFHVAGAPAPGPCPVTEVAINVTSLPASLAFWRDFLGFTLEAQDGGAALLSCSERGCRLRLVQLPAGEAMRHGTAFGRIAFSCPGERLQQLQADVQAAGYTVHTPYVSLDTPGKATVQVVILADPDGHEICLVGDEGFRDLSALDPAAGALLDQAVAADGSKAWYEKREAAIAAAEAAAAAAKQEANA